MDRDRCENTASDLWAELAEGSVGEADGTPAEGDTSYRSAKNEALLAKRRLVSRVHRKKPRGRAMAPRTRRANARKSAVRASVEHVFAYQKGPMGLVTRTIGLGDVEEAFHAMETGNVIRSVIRMTH